MCIKKTGLITSNLLHMAEDILPAVKNTLSLLRIQVEDEISGVVGIAVFISTRTFLRTCLF